jgi:integrase/recombinase XerD
VTSPAVTPVLLDVRPRLTASAHLQSAITAWREQMAKDDVSPNTIKAFGGDLNLFAQFTGVGKEVGQVTTRELNEWLTWQRTTKKCSPKTYARRVTSLKSFFRWLQQTQILTKDPAVALIQQSVLSPLPDYLTPSEVEQALIAAHALRHADKPDMRPEVLLTLLLQTGLKKSECLMLKPDDVDGSNPDEPVLWVRYEKTEHRYKERKLKLDPEWLFTYREYLAQYEPRDALFPWSPRRLEYLLEDITKVGGLSKHISFEMCRWTFAMREVRAGVDYNHIRQKLGLSKIQWREIGMKLERLVEGEGAT